MMRYDTDFRYTGPANRASLAGAARRRDYPRGGGELVGRGEYGDAYEAPYREAAPRWPVYDRPYFGSGLRSRGSYEAGQLRSGLNPRDEFEFDWGGGYVGGRGYGGTNYDYEHGYRTAGFGPALYGPARYGYGPYYDRLHRQQRADDEIREDVEESFFYDTWIDADRITVEVDDGVVTLRGTLPNYNEVRYATDDAWDVDGVRGVRSELHVQERSATDRLGHRREYSPANLAEENEDWTSGTAPAGLSAAAGSLDERTAARAAEQAGDYSSDQSA